jgi:hypothetical protein
MFVLELPAYGIAKAFVKQQLLQYEPGAISSLTGQRCRHAKHWVAYLRPPYPGTPLPAAHANKLSLASARCVLPCCQPLQKTTGVGVLCFDVAIAYKALLGDSRNKLSELIQGHNELRVQLEQAQEAAEVREEPGIVPGVESAASSASLL